MGVDGGEDIAGVVLVRFLYVRVFFLVASNVMSLLSFLYLLSEPGAEAALTPALSSPTSMPPCRAVSELAMSLAFFWGVFFCVLLRSAPLYVQCCVGDLSPPEAKEEESTSASLGGSSSVLVGVG